MIRHSRLFLQIETVLQKDGYHKVCWHGAGSRVGEMGFSKKNLRPETGGKGAKRYLDCGVRDAAP